jgi:hypothetical protein
MLDDDSDPGVPMTGTVYLPASARTDFTPNSAIVTWPDLQKGITDGNFDALSLRMLDSTHIEQLAAALAKLKSITGLYLYDVINADSYFESKCIGVINQYPNLTRLFTNMIADGRSVRQIRRLRMLQHLHLEGIAKNYDDVFASLRGSTHLTVLLLKDFPMTTPAVRDICTCCNLEVLDCHRSKWQIQIQGYQLGPLANLKKLKKLKLEAICFSPALIEALGKCQSLRELRCELDTDWSRGQRMALRQALPNTEVWMYWKGAGKKMLQLHYLPGQTQPVQESGHQQ